MHDLFFVIGAFVELFTVTICSSVFGCDVQQERNWEFVNVYTTLILFSNGQFDTLFDKSHMVIHLTRAHA